MATGISGLFKTHIVIIITPFMTSALPTLDSPLCTLRIPQGVSSAAVVSFNVLFSRRFECALQVQALGTPDVSRSPPFSWSSHRLSVPLLPVPSLPPPSLLQPVQHLRSGAAGKERISSAPTPASHLSINVTADLAAVPTRIQASLLVPRLPQAQAQSPPTESPSLRSFLSSLRPPHPPSQYPGPQASVPCTGSSPPHAP